MSLSFGPVVVLTSGASGASGASAFASIEEAVGLFGEWGFPF